MDFGGLVVEFAPMRFTEKLVRLTEGHNKSQIARNVGLSSTAVTDYIQKGALPRCDIALRLARTLSVPVEWLLDDEQGWPPPKVQPPSMQSIPDHELLAEVGRRYWMLLMDWGTAVEAAEAADWATAERLVRDTPLTSAVPPDLRPFVMLYKRLEEGILRQGFWRPEDIVSNSWQLYTDDPERVEAFRPDRLRSRTHGVLQRPGCDAVAQYLANRMDARMRAEQPPTPARPVRPPGKPSGRASMD